MTAPDRSIARVLGCAATLLAEASETPRLDAELLLARVAGLSRAQLLTRPEELLPDSAVLQFDALVHRRKAGEPIAYVLGTREFWTLTLEVDASVLVPRPDTELLVELALREGDALAQPPTPGPIRASAGNPAHGPPQIATRARSIRVADLGTGSGAIAIAIAQERPSWSVTATDRSTSALALARRNAERTGVSNVEFLHGNWLEAVGTRSFEVIVSNPPYIAAADPVLTAAPLRFEPRGALTDEADGLRDLLHIAETARPHLAPGGVLLLEHAPAQAEPLRAVLESHGYRHVRSHRDLAGYARAMSATTPETLE